MDLTLSQFYLHPLPCSFPLEVHPNHLSLTRQIDDWAIRSLQARSPASRRKIVDSKLSVVACLTTPRGRDDRLMLLAGKHLWAMLLLDDALESCGSAAAASGLASKVVEVAAGRDVLAVDPNEEDQREGEDEKDFSEGGEPLHLFQDVMAEIQEAMPPPMFDRYLRYLSHYMDAVIQEVRYQLAGHIPREDEYRVLRRATSFTSGTTGLFGEFCMGLSLSESVTTSADYLELVGLVADHVTLVNDVVSFRKDFYARVTHNWLFVLLEHSHRGRGFQAALDTVCEMIRDTEDRILEVQSRIERTAVERGDNDLLRFARFFPLCLAGNKRWSFITARYHGIGNPLLSGNEFHGTVLMHPDATIVLPSTLC